MDEARKLREDAQKVLADYQRKQRNAQSEAEDIIAQAKREAEAYAEETRTALKESLERRSKLAEEKIARANTQIVRHFCKCEFRGSFTTQQNANRLSFEFFRECRCLFLSHKWSSRRVNLSDSLSTLCARHGVVLMGGKVPCGP